MRRIGAAAAVTAILALGASSAAAKRQPVLAFVWNGSVVSLARVDAMSLRPTGGPSLVTGAGAFYVARSPRGATLALDTDRGAVLSFVDARTLRRRGSIGFGDGWIAAASWPAPRRLVAVIGSESRTRVVTVDPATRRFLSDQSLPFGQTLLTAAVAGGRVVFLVGASDSIAPIRLAVAGPNEAIRTVLLDRVSGGFQPPADYSTGVAREDRPALAVEPNGRRAAVVGAGGLVAEVDLGSLAVSYHPRSVRVPARAGKALSGWQRSALWLPSGALAVTGMDYSASVANGTEEMSGTAAGITLVDTDDWTSTSADTGASFVMRAGSTLVAYGGDYVSGPGVPTGIGLRGYTADGKLRFQLFGTEQIGDVGVAGGLVYVGSCNGRCFRIVDPASGAVVATPRTVRTTQLVGP